MAKGVKVGGKFIRGFLESHGDTGFAILLNTLDEELHPRPGSCRDRHPRNNRGPAQRPPVDIEAGDSGGCLFQDGYIFFLA